MPRLIFTATTEMENDLKSIAEKRNMTVSNLIRVLLAEVVAKEAGGSTEDYRVKVGGLRERDTPE